MLPQYKDLFSCKNVDKWGNIKHLKKQKRLYTKSFGLNKIHTLLCYICGLHNNEV
jgi:hypothetical protein